MSKTELPAEEPGTREPTTQETRAQQLVNLATFVRGLSDEAATELRHFDNTFNVCVNNAADPAGMIALWAEEASRCDLPVSRWAIDEYAGIRLEFGLAHFDVYASKDRVCPRPTPDDPRRWPEQLANLPWRK